MYAMIVGALLGVMFVLSFVTSWKESKTIVDELIAMDVAHLSSILNKINETCVIIDFDHQKNFIDFLNVGSFTGSEVGPMNLTYPEQWEGPYIDDNPTVQDQYYQVVQTDKGHFVVPGPGVELSDGNVIGKDIVFDETTDIQALIDDGVLMFEKQALAARIAVG